MRRSLIAVLVTLTSFGVHSAPATANACKWPEDMKTVPDNLDFADGPVGAAPQRWLLGPEWFMPPHAQVYSAVAVSTDQCHANRQCAKVSSLRSDPAVSLAFLYQDQDVTPHRGEMLTYRAFVRVDPALKSVARLLVRLHRKDCSTTFRDDMGNNPVISGDWAAYEIHAPIAMDAYPMEFGMQLIGQGAAWIDQISMTFSPMR